MRPGGAGSRKGKVNVTPVQVDLFNKGWCPGILPENPGKPVVRSTPIALNAGVGVSGPFTERTRSRREGQDDRAQRDIRREPRPSASPGTWWRGVRAAS